MGQQNEEEIPWKNYPGHLELIHRFNYRVVLALQRGAVSYFYLMMARKQSTGWHWFYDIGFDGGGFFKVWVPNEPLAQVYPEIVEEAQKIVEGAGAFFF